MGDIKAAIFDLDGALVDSAPDIRAAINKLFAEEASLSGRNFAHSDYEIVSAQIVVAPVKPRVRARETAAGEGLPTPDEALPS